MTGKMTRLMTILTSMLLLTAFDCAPTSAPKPIDYRETPVPTGTNHCEAAQKHLQEMCLASPLDNQYCCEVVSPTKKGLSFSAFCRETQEAGIALNPMCISTVTICGQIDECVGTERNK